MNRVSGLSKKGASEKIAAITLPMQLSDPDLAGTSHDAAIVGGFDCNCPILLN